MLVKCKCPSDTHGHKPGKCRNLAQTPEGMCEQCAERAAAELAALNIIDHRKGSAERKPER